MPDCGRQDRTLERRHRLRPSFQRSRGPGTRWPGGPPGTSVMTTTASLPPKAVSPSPGRPRERPKGASDARPSRTAHPSSRHLVPCWICGGSTLTRFPSPSSLAPTKPDITPRAGGPWRGRPPRPPPRPFGACSRPGKTVGGLLRRHRSQGVSVSRVTIGRPWLSTNASDRTGIR